MANILGSIGSVTGQVLTGAGKLAGKAALGAGKLTGKAALGAGKNLLSGVSEVVKEIDKKSLDSIGRSIDKFDQSIPETDKSLDKYKEDKQNRISPSEFLLKKGPILDSGIFRPTKIREDDIVGTTQTAVNDIAREINIVNRNVVQSHNYLSTALKSQADLLKRVSGNLDKFQSKQNSVIEEINKLKYTINNNNLKNKSYGSISDNGSSASKVIEKETRIVDKSDGVASAVKNYLGGAVGGAFLGGLITTTAKGIIPGLASAAVLNYLIKNKKEIMDHLRQGIHDDYKDRYGSNAAEETKSRSEFGNMTDAWKRFFTTEVPMLWKEGKGAYKPEIQKKYYDAEKEKDKIGLSQDDFEKRFGDDFKDRFGSWSGNRPVMTPEMFLNATKGKMYRGGFSFGQPESNKTGGQSQNLLKSLREYGKGREKEVLNEYERMNSAIKGAGKGGGQPVPDLPFIPSTMNTLTPIRPMSFSAGLGSFGGDDGVSGGYGLSSGGDYGGGYGSSGDSGGYGGGSSGNNNGDGSVGGTANTQTPKPQPTYAGRVGAISSISSNGGMSLGHGASPVSGGMSVVGGQFKDPGGGLSSLSADRAKFATELSNNPALRDKILMIAANEQSTHPQGTLAVMESLMNRASYQGTSLERQAKWTNERGYYDNKKGLARATNILQNHREFLEGNLQKALGGSNVAKYATDNASGDWGMDRINRGMYHLASTYGGEYFSTPGWGPGEGNQRKYKSWRERMESGASVGSTTTTSGQIGITGGPAIGSDKGSIGGKSPLEGFVTRFQHQGGANQEGAPQSGGGTKYISNADRAIGNEVPGRPKLSGDLTSQFPENTERFFHQGGHVQGVDKSLLHLLKESSKDLPPGYRMEMISGKDARSTGTTNHPSGIAADVQIFDSRGKLIPHDSNSAGWKYYEQMYQSMAVRGKELYPENRYIWGGTWIGGGAPRGDPMHYQRLIQGVGSQGSGVYNINTGVPRGHPFYSEIPGSHMTPEEIKAYQERIREKLTPDSYVKNPDAFPNANVKSGEPDNSKSISPEPSNFDAPRSGNLGELPAPAATPIKKGDVTETPNPSIPSDVPTATPVKPGEKVEPNKDRVVPFEEADTPPPVPAATPVKKPEVSGEKAEAIKPKESKPEGKLYDPDMPTPKESLKAADKENKKPSGGGGDGAHPSDRGHNHKPSSHNRFNKHGGIGPEHRAHHPEQRHGTPGNRGYGGKKASPDGIGICSI